MSGTAEGRSSVTEQELRDGIVAIMATLREVDDGELQKRVELSGAGAEPLQPLAAAINDVIELFAGARGETVAYQRELEGQIGTIEKQRAAIRELSTPIIEVWAGVLCVPIVGVLDSSRAAEMTSALLTALTEKKAAFTIVDITGIDVMDTGATDHLLRMARSVRLLGAECVLSGVNPSVARTIVHMGMDLGGIRSHRTLRDALKHYVARRTPDKQARVEK